MSKCKFNCFIKFDPLLIFDAMTKIDFTPSATFNLHELMLHRVYEILLLASPYDAYILEEDGQLTEQIMIEYLGMNFKTAPRVWREPTATSALQIIPKRKFDLIIVMARISDMDPVVFCQKVKEKYPKKPVILLAADESELAHIRLDEKKSCFDRTFIWSGNANVFTAIIKYIEDKLNASRDVKIGDVGIIIYIEDTPRDYSVILPLLYQVILNYTNQLVSTSLNAAQRLFHLRGRPKILLASSYEEAQKFYNKYRANILGIISDINFPYKGKKNPDAGLKFAQWVRKKDPVMPIMLQSRHQDVRELANNIKAHFLYKKSTRLLRDIEHFIITNFGFGDFIFRLPDGSAIAMATNLMEIVALLKTIPDESLIYHADHNHFSNWLAARSEYELASKIRPLRESNFPSTNEHRQTLIRIISGGVKQQHSSRIINFSTDAFEPSINFVRLTPGYLGGKARGLAFAIKMLNDSGIREKYADIDIRVPHVAVLGTDEFDRFMNHNNLWEAVLPLQDNKKINKLFLKSALSHDLEKILTVFLSKIHYPLAVRSSSLLEDSPYQPLAGMYSTYMYPNAGKTLKARVAGLSKLIKLVCASMFNQEPRSILENTTNRLEEEKMAVVIQELAGQSQGEHFYPDFSGVAQSINYYPVSYMQREEGVAYVALGLGRTIVEGEKALRFSPKYPAILPQFYSIKATLAASQNSFYALKLQNTKDHSNYSESRDLAHLRLQQAEKDGTLKAVASVICENDSVIRDSLNYDGTRIVSFAPILKWKAFPLADIINDILEMGELAMGGPVELEFAVNMSNNSTNRPQFNLLQIRPMPHTGIQSGLNVSNVTKKNTIVRSHVTLGDGSINYIKNILVVKKDTINSTNTVEIAGEIEQLNKIYGKGKPYISIGPGRWGTADPSLGIPIRWDQISNAKVIVEVGIDNFNIDPSFGSHFFQIVTGLKIAYFTINPKNKADSIDWDWLSEVNPITETAHISWLELPYPLQVHINGISGKGIIMKPTAPVKNIEPMDEQESSGI